MLPPGSGLPILSLLFATLLSECASMVTYYFRRLGNPYGWLSVNRLHPIWPVHLALETLWRGGLAWVCDVDTVCCSPA